MGGVYTSPLRTTHWGEYVDFAHPNRLFLCAAIQIRARLFESDNNNNTNAYFKVCAQFQTNDSKHTYQTEVAPQDIIIKMATLAPTSIYCRNGHPSFGVVGLAVFAFWDLLVWRWCQSRCWPGVKPMSVVLLRGQRLRGRSRFFCLGVALVAGQAALLEHMPCDHHSV